MKRRLVLFLAATLLLGLTTLSSAAPGFVPLPGIDRYLTPANLARLEKGEVVLNSDIYKDAKGNDQGRGVAIVLVRANPDRVMAELASFETYSAWMPSVEKTQVLGRNGNIVEVEFVLSIMWNEVRYTCVHKIDRTAGTLQWYMNDKRPKKNVQDSTGGWVLKSLGPGKTVVGYTTSVEVGLMVPKVIATWLTNSSLPDVLKAVKKRVEGR